MLWPYLWRYRLRVAIGLIFLVIAKLANIGVPLLLKRIIDQLEGNQELTLVAVPLGLIAGYGVLRLSSIVFNELRNVVFAKASINSIHTISIEVFQQLHRLSLSFHLDRKTGALSRDIERGTRAIMNFMRLVVFSILPTIFEIAVVIGILLINFESKFALVTAATILIYSIFTYAVTQWRTRFRVEMNAAESNSNTNVLDSLLNYETVKVFGNEVMETQRLRTILDGWSRASMQSTISLSFLNVGQAIIIAIGLTILLLMAAQGVTTGALSLGDFVMINAFLIQLYIPLNFLGSIYRDITHSLIDMQRLFDLLAEKPDVVEQAGAKELQLHKGGEIEFRNVSFRYQPDLPLLDDLSFTLASGTTTAIVGPSGSGKSTLSRLLFRFYDPDKGEILIDDQNIKDCTLDSVRKEMGYVPQESILFNETIGYNIKYGKPDASNTEMQAAAERAQIDQLIESHPQKYDILVGERGLKLSGGEKQRVAIARLVMKEASILVFDEATSSLDSRSEKAIQASIADVSKGNTSLIIAHRLSTVIDADQILVLDKGKISEAGTHQELLKNKGLYAQMWAMQQSDELESN
ncbi:MAG: ABC-type transport system involved in Fe-S cluster assembly fused permease/ATPase subunit [Saprospiraceae bacterium]|jgi:ABC-type transport system involved in Fe-S cluster assembly fused permease/ATPase subunit